MARPPAQTSKPVQQQKRKALRMALLPALSLQRSLQSAADCMGLRPIYGTHELGNG